jgi:hypothetical protein
MPSPLITIIVKTSAIIARAVADLGFTPTSRSKVVQSSGGRNPGEPHNSLGQVPLEEYLAYGDRLREKDQVEALGTLTFD